METNEEWIEDIANMLNTMRIFAEYMTEKNLWGEFSVWVVEKRLAGLSDMLAWLFTAPVHGFDKTASDKS